VRERRGGGGGGGGGGGEREKGWRKKWKGKGRQERRYIECSSCSPHWPGVGDTDEEGFSGLPRQCASTLIHNSTGNLSVQIQHRQMKQIKHVARFSGWLCGCATQSMRRYILTLPVTTNRENMPRSLRIFPLWYLFAIILAGSYN
jgi:hypothetical protein